jgi:hypothetical protein
MVCLILLQLFNPSELLTGISLSVLSGVEFVDPNTISPDYFRYQEITSLMTTFVTNRNNGRPLR